jgi:MFS family permease
MLAALMNTLDTTIANVALPHMQGSLSASQDQITWVLTSYIIATAVTLPLSGWVSEKIGRKRMFLLSIGAFTIASMLCGIATSLPEIVLFRLLQGMAAASLMPLSQAVMLDIFPARLVPRVMSLWSAALVMGPVMGPTIGGWLTENFSWRWTARAAIAMMKQNPNGPSGSIIINSSMNANRAMGNYMAYSVTKSAVVALTKSVATHCGNQGYAIRCNAILPGVVETDMIRGVIDRAPDPAAARAQFEGMAPLKRMAGVEEIAALVSFLASDEATFISGSEYVIDGATTAGMNGV